MTYPVSGPFEKVDYLLFPPPWESERTYFRWSKWYRQKPPFNLRLDYELKLGSAQGNLGGPFVGSGANSESMFDWNSNLLNWAQDKAWERFVANCRDSSQLGTTLAEMGQASAMISARALQLLGFARAVRRLDFRGAAHYLDLSSKAAVYGAGDKMKRRWNKTHNLADVWLEVHFGWAPLLDDLSSATKVLGQNIRPKRVTASATEKSASSTGSGSGIRFALEERLSVRYQADISVENENVALLSALGLANPVAVAWELVPWSFLVDHVVNVSAFLNGYTDLAGLSVVNPATTQFQVKLLTWSWVDAGSSGTTSAVHVRRQLTLARPTLHLRRLKLPGVSRGATYASLLAQALPRSAPSRGY